MLSSSLVHLNNKNSLLYFVNWQKKFSYKSERHFCTQVSFIVGVEVITAGGIRGTPDTIRRDGACAPEVASASCCCLYIAVELRG